VTTLSMLLAAAGIGVGHAILPDHWMPLALLARTRRYPFGRVARLALAAAVTHVLMSVVFGAALAAVGLRLREAVARHADLAVGGVLVATGVALLVLEVAGRGHRHDHSDRGADCGHRQDDHSHGHGRAGADGEETATAAPLVSSQAEPGSGHAVAVLERPAAASASDHRRRTILNLLGPFGAAVSPDLTILPLFLTAGALGVGPALGVLAVFALATIVVMVGLTLAAAFGARRLTAPWIEERATLLTAATLLAIGGLVVSGVL
jgi:nickel/cobalt transporter (NicO) family protein